MGLSFQEKSLWLMFVRPGRSYSASTSLTVLPADAVNVMPQPDGAVHTWRW